jgi:hypothetical protein
VLEANRLRDEAASRKEAEKMQIKEDAKQKKAVKKDAKRQARIDEDALMAWAL